MDKVSRLGYVSLSVPEDNIAEESRRFFYKNGKEEIAAHCADVANTCAGLAERFSLDRNICEAAGYVHDAGGVIKPEDMLAMSVESGWHIDKAEQEYPFLLHQRWGAVLAREYFCLDERIIRAVECHTTLRRNATEYDMALFLADKLSWDQEGAPPFRDTVLEGLEFSLCCGAYKYFQYVLEHNMILHPHRWFLEAWEWLRGIEENIII